MPRLRPFFGGCESSSRVRRRQQKHQDQSHSTQQLIFANNTQRDNQTISEQDSQIISKQNSARDVSEIEAYTGPCHLLNLPFEIRELIFHWIYGSITVYLRSLPTDPGNTNRYIVWTNVVEWNNPCPSLLRVNRQLRDEALRVVLQNCVLDVWGSSNLVGSFLNYLPTAAAQIKYMAITFERLYADVFDRTMLSSLETLFVDSIPISQREFVEKFAHCIRDPSAGHSAFTAIVRFMSLEHQTSREGQRPLRIFVRCKTFYEETTLLITDLKRRPEVWRQPVVPKFEYKSLTQNAYGAEENEEPDLERFSDDQWLALITPRA